MSRQRPRIVVNALMAQGGGAATYAPKLLGHLAKGVPADVHVLAAPEQRERLPDAPYELVECPWAGRSGLHRVVWEELRLDRVLRELQPDVYYTLGTTLGWTPPAGCRSAVAFRNVLPFSPEHRRLYAPGYTRIRLELLRVATARALSLADLVIFVSRHGRDLIDGLLPERRGRSVVIPHGVEDAFFATTGSSPFAARWPEGYVLYVSILDVYKAQLEVLEAWAELRSRRPTREKLVLAGPEYRPYGRRVRRRIAELGLADQVVLLGPVPHAELPGLYEGARLNLFASRCENCPNILLEALAGGRPVACSSDPPMPEFGADAVAYFDPGDPPALAALLGELLDDEEARNRLAKRAAERGAEFRLDACMEETWRCLLELAGAEPSSP